MIYLAALTMAAIVICILLGELVFALLKPAAVVVAGILTVWAVLALIEAIYPHTPDLPAWPMYWGMAVFGLVTTGWVIVQSVREGVQRARGR